jgi:hypothetical protein
MGTSQSKIVKGSFGPTFGAYGKGSNASISESGAYGRHSDEDKAPAPTRRSQKRKQRTKDYGSPQEFKWNDLGSLRPTRSCQACGQLYDWKKCFYLFTNKASEGFKERPAIRRLVNLSLKID